LADQLHTEDSIQDGSELLGSKFVKDIRRGHTQQINRNSLK